MKARSLFCSLLCPQDFEEHLVIIGAQKELTNEGEFIPSFDISKRYLENTFLVFHSSPSPSSLLNFHFFSSVSLSRLLGFGKCFNSPDDPSEQPRLRTTLILKHL